MRVQSVLFLGLLATGCTGASVDEPMERAPNAETPALTAAELSESSERVALVPSPVETQRALESAGIETQLSGLIQDRDFDTRNENPDNAAVRTGVIIADMLLTVKTSSKEDLLRHLDQLEQGMTQLDGGRDILAMLDEIKDRVRADAVTRDELLQELDELSGAFIPELEFNGRERIVPLIQAGSWLEGANLLSRAVKEADQPETADELLKQPSVVAYFLEYVQKEGADKAPEAVTQKLESSLVTLEGIAKKSEPLTMDDVDVVITTTNDVLALL